MKHNKLMFLAVGFITGAIYIAACGGTTQSIAAAIGNAIDVIFDNTDSGLTATNVQTAIDELNTKIAALEATNKSGEDLAADLVGSWTGTFCNGGTGTTDEKCTNISLTLNSDGSLSCVGGEDYDNFNGACEDPGATWSILARTLQLTYSSSGDDWFEYYTIFFASLTTLEMSEGVQHLYSLTKSE